MYKSHSFSKQCLSKISVIQLPDNFLSFPKHDVTVFLFLISLSSSIMPVTMRKTELQKTNANHTEHPKINQTWLWPKQKAWPQICSLLSVINVCQNNATSSLQTPMLDSSTEIQACSPAWEAWGTWDSHRQDRGTMWAPRLSGLADGHQLWTSRKLKNH